MQGRVRNKGKFLEKRVYELVKKVKEIHEDHFQHNFRGILKVGWVKISDNLFIHQIDPNDHHLDFFFRNMNLLDYSPIPMVRMSCKNIPKVKFCFRKSSHQSKIEVNSIGRVFIDNFTSFFIFLFSFYLILIKFHISYFIYIVYVSLF